MTDNDGFGGFAKTAGMDVFIKPLSFAYDKISGETVVVVARLGTGVHSLADIEFAHGGVEQRWYSQLSHADAIGISRFRYIRARNRRRALSREGRSVFRQMTEFSIAATRLMVDLFRGIFSPAIV